jgi:hypothetical protein
VAANSSNIKNGIVLRALDKRGACACPLVVNSGMALLFFADS